ncbi:unnamed protein product [Phytomonas sp. EM1]|nr:unnamed protein product [Phytomonas sp. EM1]|eukprot:CCW63858.1 unnamed protein product [Phytomonas sp. isolate EM1]
MESIEEEIAMVRNLFGEDCTQREGHPRELWIRLPFSFELEITLPAGYFEESHPHLFVRSAPNAPLAGSFAAILHQRMRETIPLGTPMLALLVSLAQDLARELEEGYHEERESLAARENDAVAALSQENDRREREAIPIWSGTVVVDRRSRFVAHLAPVGSVEEVKQVIATLRADRHLSDAAHPTIWAYRFKDDRGVLHSDFDDDGETGAAVKMAFLLDQLKVEGYVVVVTRWFGGILLGPDRFKHIMGVTKDILLTIPEREKSKSQPQRRRD